mgnify:CR=1 FL=1
MSYNVEEHQAKLHKVNEFNIFTSCPDVCYNNGDEPFYHFIKELTAIASNTPYTEEELNAVDTYFAMNITDDIDINWQYHDDLSGMMYSEDKYLDTTTHEHFVESALQARATAIQHKHRFTIVDIALDCLLTHKYLQMLRDHDYRLEYFVDYAEALTTALSNVDLSFYHYMI